MQKQAEAKLAERRGAGAGAEPAAQQASSAGQPPMEAPLLFDLVFEAEADLCIKVDGGRGPSLLVLMLAAWGGPA